MELRREGFCPKTEVGNSDKDVGICPTNSLSETLKSWRSERLMSGIKPENRFDSNRRVRRCVKCVSVGGISPEKLLKERSRR